MPAFPALLCDARRDAGRVVVDSVLVRVLSADK
jgi:hypothetical protein